MTFFVVYKQSWRKIIPVVFTGRLLRGRLRGGEVSRAQNESRLGKELAVLAACRFARTRERKDLLQRDDDDELNKLRGLISFDVVRGTYPSLDATEPYNSFSFARYVNYA